MPNHHQDLCGSRTLRVGAFALALAALVLLPGASAAMGQDALLRADASGSYLATPGGVTFRTTGNVVRDLQTVQVSDSRLQLYTWQEEKANGALSSYYAISRDGVALAGRVRQADYDVELYNFRFDPAFDAPVLNGALAARPSSKMFIVQMVATPLPELQAYVEKLGGKIHRHLTNYSMVVEMEGATRSAVSDLPFVRWVGPYHPAYRVTPEMRDAIAGEAAPLGSERYSIMLFERGLEAQQTMASLLTSMGVETLIFTPEGFRMEAILNQGQLTDILHTDLVQFVDVWGGPGETDMDIVRMVGGGDYVETVGNFRGQGVVGEIFDTELLPTHDEWANTPILHSVGSSGGLHGSSCFSNVFAQGTNAAAKGMAPDGQGIFFILGESTQFGGAKTRYTIAEELMDPAGPYKGLFQTSSVGSARVTTYTTISAEMDDVLFDNQVVHTQSQSNSGGPPSRPQAWSKNIVSVGGVRHLGTADRSDDNHGNGGSTGPADDGRIKPDLSFFYDGIFSASGGGNSSYTSFGGTSSATPQTAGHFALFFQMWHEGVWTGFGGGATPFDNAPKMMTSKAMVIHNAFRYDWNSGGANSDLTRVRQGWGTPDLRNLFDNADETFIIDETEVLAPLGTYAKTVNVPAGEPMFKATMSYIDPMATVGAAVHRINDLSLKVTAPDGTIYWGNNGLLADNFSTSGGSSNTLDTVENVFVENPDAGDWLVEVIADEVVQDAHVETGAIDADFALVISPASAFFFADGFESGDLTGWQAVEP